MTLREHIRVWLFREEIERLVTIYHDIGALKETAERALRDQLILLRVVELQRDKLDKLMRLIEPHAPRIRAGRPYVPQEWDQVQQENLKQFEETDERRRT